MDDERITRLQRIAGTTWLRIQDDRSGLSWEEINRKNDDDARLPVEERIQAEKAEHLIERQDTDKLPEENP